MNIADHCRVIAKYLDAPMDQTVLGRAVLKENRLGIILNYTGSAIYYLFTRGGLLAGGAYIAAVAYSMGASTGHTYYDCTGIATPPPGLHAIPPQDNSP